MEELVQGTIEELPVEITDRLQGITTLDGLTVQFRVTEEDGTEVVAWTNCNNDEMKALPLINTTTWDSGIFRLYVKVDVTPEHPIIGPFEFAVIP